MDDHKQQSIRNEDSIHSNIKKQRSDMISAMTKNEIDGKENILKDTENMLSVLFKIHCKSSDPLIIEGIDRLSVDEQLNILKIENLSLQKIREDVAISLYHKLPELKENILKRLRFKSTLLSYYESYIKLQSVPIQEMTSNQLPLSLYMYLVKDLQKIPINDEEKQRLVKDKKISASSWQFVHYFYRFCDDQQFDGQSLHKMWAEITNNGRKSGFGLKFIQKICNEYSLKFGKFVRTKKKIGLWMNYQIERAKQIENAISSISINYDEKQEDVSSEYLPSKPKPVKISS